MTIARARVNLLIKNRPLATDLRCVLNFATTYRVWQSIKKSLRFYPYEPEGLINFGYLVLLRFSYPESGVLKPRMNCPK